MGLSDYVEAMESRWRFAEANVAMLRDALTEFHVFVAAELDPDPHPIEAYLAGWDAERIQLLRSVLYGAAATTQKENAQ